MTPFRQPSVFVSATSRGLKPLRIAAAEHLQARKFDVVVQEEFDCDYQRIKDMIRDKIAPCDAVVLLVGPAYGFQPTDWPAGLPRRSYTQLEYDLAVELKKPVYRYLASDRYPLAPFDPEPADARQRQAEYIAHLRGQDHVWYQFDSQDQLLALLGNTRFHKLVRPNLPFDSIGTLFKGREEAMAAVRTSLLTRPAHATAVTSRQAIHGLGGVGKTRFAVEYAHRYASEYSARLYANADTASALASNLAALVHVLDLPEKDEKEQPKQLEAVERWLRMHAGWLLILDNVDTAEAQAAVNAVFPKLATGHVLVTSRLTDWGAGVNSVELDTLSIPASTEFLLERTDRDPARPTEPARQATANDPSDAKGLAEYLGGLALALEQAGAYICANRITFAEYRQRLGQIERDVLNWFDPAVMNYPRSVAVTWQASVRKLHEEGRHLLNLLCWLAPDPIPVALIRTEPKEPPHFPIEDRERALRDLSAYSLAKWNATGDAVTVHRLVQDVTRTRLTEPTRAEALKDALAAMDAFAEGDPQDVRTWATVFTPVRSHLKSVSVAGDGLGIAAPTGHILSQYGNFLSAKGEYTEAEWAMRKALALAETDGEPEDLPTFAVRLSNLGEILRNRQSFVEAESVLRRALDICSEHSPLVAGTVCNNLATLFHGTNRLVEAETYARKALAHLEQALVVNHPMVGVVSSTLATILMSQGRRAESEKLLIAALKTHATAIGQDHPAYATDLNNLAILWMQSGRQVEAGRALQRVIQILEMRFGDHHPAVAIGLGNLAEVQRQMGQPLEAERLFRQALAICEHVHPANHTDTIKTLNGLGRALVDQKRLPEAETQFRRGLELVAESRVPNHPASVELLNNLAVLLVNTARPRDAKPLLQQTLTIAESVHGPNHTEVARALKNYGFLVLRYDSAADAEPFFRRALAIDEAACGADAAQLPPVLNTLAAILQVTNRMAEAIPLMARAVSISETHFGATNPNTVFLRENYDNLIREHAVATGGGSAN